MRLLGVTLENYIGIYNGTGQEIITIDFTKATHHIIAIQGHNGSGKSTLLKSLTPFADDNSSFIPGKKASKLISYEYNGIKYDIQYIHDIKSDGSRETTKAQLWKNGMIMNPNWNVSNCKDLIFSIFNLDPNFITLSQLSSEDRGLADKRPAERKKFINTILENLSDYNNMYKILSKKSSTLKALIMSVNSKIGSLGKKDELLIRLTDLDKQINIVKERRDNVNKSIGAILAKMDNLDKNKDIIERYTKLDKSIESDKSLISIGITKFKNFFNGSIYGGTVNVRLDADEILNNHDALNKLNTDMIKYKVSIESIESDLKDKIKEQKEIYNKISELNGLVNKKQAEVDILKDYTVDINALYKTRDSHKQTMGKVLTWLNKNSLSNLVEGKNINNVSPIELDNFIDSYSEIIQQTLSTYSRFNTHTDSYIFLETLISYNKNTSSDILKKIEMYNNDIEMAIDNKAVYVSKLNEISNLESIAKILKDRPSKCKIDDCIFIKNAVEASNKLKDLYLSSKGYNDDIHHADIIINDTREKVKLMTEAYNIGKDLYNQFTRLISLANTIKKYSELTTGKNKDSELKTAYDLLSFVNNFNLFITFVSSRNVEVEKDINNSIFFIQEISNNLKLYNTSKTAYASLNSKILEDKDKFKEAKDALDALNNLKDKLSDMNDRGIKSSVNISDKKKLIDLYNSNINLNKDIVSYIEMIDNYKELLKKDTNDREVLKSSFEIIKDLETKLSKAKEQLKVESIQLDSLLLDRNKVAHNLTLIDDYLKEIELYNTTYDKIEKIKYYTSPTTGIQTIFMGLYMNNIIMMANQLLELMFGGTYKLLPFIINESEFRIPCSGEGYTNDDISSMSTSQICMISMILSFSILNYASNDYNIIKLDEIDGGLDTENRLQFIKLLEQIMIILRCEQCIMISHNSELDLDDIDVILMSKDYDISANTNVIFRP